VKPGRRAPRSEKNVSSGLRRVPLEHEVAKLIGAAGYWATAKPSPCTQQKLNSVTSEKCGLRWCCSTNRQGRAVHDAPVDGVWTRILRLGDTPRSTSKSLVFLTSNWARGDAARINPEFGFQSAVGRAQGFTASSRTSPWCRCQRFSRVVNRIDASSPTSRYADRSASSTTNCDLQTTSTRGRQRSFTLRCRSRRVIPAAEAPAGDGAGSSTHHPPHSRSHGTLVVPPGEPGVRGGWRSPRMRRKLTAALESFTTAARALPCCWWQQSRPAAL